jgi:hypothetical protein
MDGAVALLLAEMQTPSAPTSSAETTSPGPDPAEGNGLWYGQIKYFHRLPTSKVSAHVRWLTPASETILGELASPREFMFVHCDNLDADWILERAEVQVLYPGEAIPPEGWFCR